MDNKTVAVTLRAFAEEIRLETFKEIDHLGFGHLGGALSILETVAVLYGHEMHYDPKNPQWPDRDWLVMSKGHAGPVLYATLALKGFFPKEQLMTLNQGGTMLPSHCDRNLTPGVDMTTGSLGQGMSTAIGVAMANAMDGRDSWTYLFAGDGECNEGQIWEGAMFAAAKSVDNLILFVDNNKQQLDGWTADVLDSGDFADKFEAFGWHTQAIDGHDIEAILDAIAEAKAAEGKPSAIILDTIKGNGCELIAAKDGNHHTAFAKGQLDPIIAAQEQIVAQARAAAGLAQ